VLAGYTAFEWVAATLMLITMAKGAKDDAHCAHPGQAGVSACADKAPPSGRIASARADP
jgi:hypothetical protein